MPVALDLDPLRDQGWLCSDRLLPRPLVEALAADARELADEGGLQPAKIGRAGEARLQPQIRGDATRWIEADPQAPVRAQFLAAADQLRVELNRRFLLGLETLEAHYALYPPGAGYARHLDRFRDDDARTVSFTVYLNPDWSGAEGGALRLWLPEGPLDVLPRLGTCTLFLSAEIEHEVLPATRPRYSIAGWFRRRERGPH